MKSRFIASTCALLLCALSATSAFAVELAGTWAGTQTGREGTAHEVTLTLQGKAPNLTGTITTMLGDAPVSNVKLAGDQISFDATLSYQGQTMTATYSGKIDGNQMELQFSRGGKVQAGKVSLTKKS